MRRLVSVGLGLGMLFIVLLACKGKPKDNSVVLEGQRKSFVDSCMKEAPSEPYCSCSFEQFKIIFKDADMKAQPTAAQLSALKDKSIVSCGELLGEEQIKSKFMGGCQSGDTSKATYCACAWTSLRKQLKLSDFLTDTSSQQFQDAERVMLKECKKR